MKLSELQITKDIKGAEKPQFGLYGNPLRDIFQKHGWNVLGKGVDAAVADHPNKNVVLKMFVSTSKYKHFVDLVKDHPNPHFPIFHKTIRELPGTKFSYVMMEKLDEISDFYNNYFPEICALMLSASKHGVDYLNRTSDMMPTFTPKRWFKNKIGVGVNDFIAYPELVWNKIDKPDDAWFQACDLLFGAFKEANMNLMSNIDFTPQNFMLRGDILVITDPFI
jgi:hypothetical protein